MEKNETAKKALKISVYCLFICIVLNLLVLSVFLVQIDSIAGLTHRLEKLERKLGISSEIP